MRNTRALPALAAALLVLALTGRAAPALEDPAARTEVTKLDNGLTVLTLEDETTPVVSFQMWVRVGSRDETRYTGLAHLFEHMMFKGSEHLPAQRHSELIESRGGVVNAYTSRDHTVYFENVTRDTLPLVIDLEAERLANLDISEDTLASERQVVLEERRMRTEDDPTGRAYESLLGLTFFSHPYRHPVIGWRSDIEEVTVEACRDFFRTYYAPNNIVIAVVGPFDTQETLERIERAMGGLEPAPEIPRNPTREPDQRGERRNTVHFDVRSPILASAWPAPPTGHEDAEALDVLSQILSAGRSSRLYRRLVRQEEQALSAQGGYWELQDAGLFLAVAAVRPDAEIGRTEALLFEEIEALRRSPPAAEEVEKAKRQLEVSLVSGLATSADLAGRIAGDYVRFGRIRPLDERLDAIQAVTPEAVQRVARTYLPPLKRSVVQVVPPPPDELASAPAGEGS